MTRLIADSVERVNALHARGTDVSSTERYPISLDFIQEGKTERYEMNELKIFSKEATDEPDRSHGPHRGLGS